MSSHKTNTYDDYDYIDKYDKYDDCTINHTVKSNNNNKKNNTTIYSNKHIRNYTKRYNK